MLRKPAIGIVVMVSVFLLAVIATRAVGSIVAAGRAESSASATPNGSITIGRAHADYAPSLTGSTPIFILILGSDSRGDQAIEQGRADSIHILGINPAAGRATLLGIPRDSWVPLATGGTNKINSALPAGGIDKEIETVENLTGIRFDYYAITAFQGFTEAVDAIGGLSMDLPYAVVGDGGGGWAAGPQHMSGADALGYARARDHLPRGDFDRSWNQGFVMLSALDQFRAQTAKHPAAVYQWLAAGLRHVQSSLDVGELMQLAGLSASIPSSRVTNLVALGTGGWEGSQSVVFLSAADRALFADLAQDGYILPRDVPKEAVATLAR
jgi:LCP family protein required for cell wall assembly